MERTRGRSKEAIRLNRFLAQLGVGSRRHCDELIAAGRVRLDGHLVKTAGVRVTPGLERISVDGVIIDRPQRPIVLLLHKPTGVVSTVDDPQGRPTVLDLCGKYGRHRRLFPVGRLDINTTGALLITNDGLLCYRLTHPRFSIPKTYNVRVRGGFDDKKLARLKKMVGPPLSGGAKNKTRVAGPSPGVRVVRQMEKVTVMRITLHEGRNRQVRRMCEVVGLHVVKLKRETFGPVSIRGLSLGMVRPLEKHELAKLYEMANPGEEGHGSRKAR